MKTTVKLILAGSVLAAAGAANAAGPITNTGTASSGSDLVLFVTDTSNNATFVQDLGVSVNSLGVTTASVNADSTAGNLYSVGGLQTIGSLNNPVGANGVDAALATFINAQPSGGHFVYGILGTSIGDGSTGIGQAREVSTITGDPTTILGGVTNISSLYTGEPSSLNASQSAQTINQFFGAVNTGNAGGTPYGASSGNGAQAASTQGVANDYALGTPVYLYEMTSMGTNDANFYGSSTPITVSANGTISWFSSPVPLPAAVWLLGSGVLGLFGIGRRRVAVSA